MIRNVALASGGGTTSADNITTYTVQRSGRIMAVSWTGFISLDSSATGDVEVNYQIGFDNARDISTTALLTIISQCFFGARTQLIGTDAGPFDASKTQNWVDAVIDVPVNAGDIIRMHRNVDDTGGLLTQARCNAILRIMESNR